MRLPRNLSVTVLTMAFLVAVSAAAKARSSKEVELHFDATVAGSHLASGNYNIQWATHSPDATVSFLKGSKVVATAEAKVVDRGMRYNSDQVLYDEAANGSREIREIRFQGSSEVLVFKD